MSNFFFLDFWKKATAETVKQEIANGADVNGRDKYGLTPLMWAGKFCKDPEAITTLIQNGADIEATEGDGRTALMYAGHWSKTVDVIKVLINNGADVNVRNKYGLKAIDYVKNNKYLQHHHRLLETPTRQCKV